MHDIYGPIYMLQGTIYATTLLLLVSDLRDKAPNVAFCFLFFCYCNLVQLNFFETINTKNNISQSKEHPRACDLDIYIYVSYKCLILKGIKSYRKELYIYCICMDTNKPNKKKIQTTLCVALHRYLASGFH